MLGGANRDTLGWQQLMSPSVASLQQIYVAVAFGLEAVLSMRTS